MGVPYFASFQQTSFNKQKQKQKRGVQKGFYGKTIGEYIYIYIYKFLNFDNIFLVGVGFKFLKLRL